MSRFQTMLEPVLERFQALNNEDKKKVLLGGGVACLLVFLLVCWGALSSLKSRHQAVERLYTELRQIDSLSEQYQKIQAQKQSRDAQIRSNKTALFTLIQNVATRLDLTVSDLNEKKEPMTGTDWVQVSVVVTLKQLSVDRFTAFVENIEDSETSGLVKITRLQVKTRFDEPDLLDVQMTVSTWKAS